MAGVTAREIMDQAITMDWGAKIVIECSSYDEMETLRGQLYKTRTRLLKTHKNLAYPLYISRKHTGENWFVVVTKEKIVSNVLIIDKDGTARPFERQETVTTLDESEDQRIRRLMKEDGKSDAEIEEYFAEKGEQDFASAAEKIEEMQGLDKDQDSNLELEKPKKGAKKSGK